MTNMEQEIDGLAKFLNSLHVRKVNLSYPGDCRILADFMVHEGYCKHHRAKGELEPLNYESVKRWLESSEGMHPAEASSLSNDLCTAFGVFKKEGN